MLLSQFNNKNNDGNNNGTTAYLLPTSFIEYYVDPRAEQGKYFSLTLTLAYENSVFDILYTSV